jgi:hypothetical protein
MSKYRRWIEADKLMERWGIGPLDLTDYVLESKLTAYTQYKSPHNIYYDLMDDEDLLEEFIEINGKMERALGSYVRFGDRVNEFIFKFDDILRFEREYQTQSDDKEKKLRSNQRHKERCRAIAALRWEENPKMTIEDMISSNEINKFGCENVSYNEKTIRTWINDLCPNRSPGRRPKPK